MVKVNWKSEAISYQDAQTGDLLLMWTHQPKPLLGIKAHDGRSGIFVVLRAPGQDTLVLPLRLNARDIDASAIGLRINGSIVPDTQVAGCRADPMRSIGPDGIGILCMAKEGAFLGVAVDATGERCCWISLTDGKLEEQMRSGVGFASWSVVCEGIDAKPCVLHEHGKSGTA